MLDTWEQRVRRDKIKVTKISFPVPTTNLSELTDRISSAITPKTKVIHICHITNLTGQLFPVRDIAQAGAGARHPDDRRRRARVRAFPVQAVRPRVRLLRLLAAQVAAGAGRYRLPVHAPREHREALAADAGRRQQDGQHPEVRGGRNASGREPQRHRRGARVSSGDRHRAQGGAAALPERSLGEAGGQAAGREDPEQPRAESGLGPVQRQPRARRRAEGVRLPLVEVPDHHRRDQARRLSGAARHAQHLHDAPGSRHLRGQRSRIC